MSLPRFRLRTLMIAVAVVALLLGTTAEVLRRGRYAVEAERRAVEVEMRHLEYLRRQGLPASPVTTGPPPPARATQRTIGPDARAPE